jgi:DNA invertase Pin-like site-specific DNA recombinase
MAMIGYARVSTADQNLDAQMDALRAAGCEQIFTDHGISGAEKDRPGFSKALQELKSGDSLCVYSLSRAGRSLQALIHLIGDLKESGIAFKSLTETIDTASTTGRLILHILGAVAQFERELIVDRVNAGLAAAKARGVVGGRPRKLDEGQIRFALDESRKESDAAAILGISERTVYRVRAAHRASDSMG